ncbi:MAG TPA: hypothetical protein VLT62_06920 [Candidatus Methylomirabilis sp.]|nr:hypothetical protein [Candidatus Methylomirabilis sp.]
MGIHEQIALRMAQERIEDAVRAAEQMRAIRSARSRRSARDVLGSALIRIGHWMMGRSSAAVS